jgi:hypothetical protein
MPFDSKGLDDYVDVAARIQEFRAKHPNGHLAPLNPAEPWSHVQMQGFDKNGDVVQQTFVVVVAAAYREPGDVSPGVGMAWEVFPGRTPYTRGSELMNAETSAWGRAIIALGAADAKRGIASQEEVRNRQAERDDGPAQLPRNGTNAGLREQGRMDRQQKGEHERLAADTVRDPKRAERSHGPDPDDPWAQDAPVDGERAAALRRDLDERLEAMRGSTFDQQQQIAIRLAAKGITSREDKLVFCSHVIERDIGSSKELSYLEATAVLKAADELEAVKA